MSRRFQFSVKWLVIAMRYLFALFVASVWFAVVWYFLLSQLPSNGFGVAAALGFPVLVAAAVGRLLGRPSGCAFAVIAYAFIAAVWFAGSFLVPDWK